MNRELIRIFEVQRRVFGVTPCCDEFFRLSDLRVFLRRPPPKSWLDRLIDAQCRMHDRRTAVEAQTRNLRAEGCDTGRRRAQRLIRKIDPVFAPRRLSADDAKPLCHPVDFLVFKGMTGPDKSITRLVLLDRTPQSRRREQLQRSIARTIRRGDVTWRTIRVDDAGALSDES